MVEFTPRRGAPSWVPTVTMIHRLVKDFFQRFIVKREFQEDIMHSQSPNNGILKNNCYNTPTSTSQLVVLVPQEAPIWVRITPIQENIG